VYRLLVLKSGGSSSSGKRASEQISTDAVILVAKAGCNGHYNRMPDLGKYVVWQRHKT
jgi:hypothetical protein